MQTSPISETAGSEYRLGRKGNVWIKFTDHSQGSAQVSGFQITARNRGGSKILAVLLDATPVRPLATVTVRGESYPLAISWHEMRRGGVLSFGGERRTGVDGGSVEWEMRWIPLHDQAGSFDVQMRVRATPRRDGHLQIFLNTPLHNPELWRMPALTDRGHGALLAWSAYNHYGLGFVTIDGEPGEWDEDRNGFATAWQGISLGGGKLLRFSCRFLSAPTALAARGALVRQYVATAGATLHPVSTARPLDDLPAVGWLTRPEAVHLVGAERMYLKTEAEKGTYYAGFPHYPGEALVALANRHRFYPGDALSRLIRFGSHALAADFQVMGRQGEAEPNKGAFWDRLTPDGLSDFDGGATHGIASNARLARALFLLFETTEEPLLRQSALNICQWLILKQNRAGYFDGGRVHATRGLADDGRFIPQPCALDGAEALRPLVLAFRTTANEVFLKAAWKIANYLMEERLPTFDALAPPDVASVIQGFCALNAEAPNKRLQNALASSGAWLRSLPLSNMRQATDDKRSSGLYECAQAGLALYALTSDTSYLRYSFAALTEVPQAHQERSWHALEARTSALLAVAALVPGWVPVFDNLTVSAGWRAFSPDPATAQYLKVTAEDGNPVDYLPLVCRLNDQLLITVVAPPETSAVSIVKNARHPLVRDLMTDTVDSCAPLHPIAGETWANAGAFLIEP